LEFVVESEATLNAGFSPLDPERAFASDPEGLDATGIVADVTDRVTAVAIDFDVADDVAEADKTEADEAICAGEADVLEVDVSETSDTCATATVPVKSSRFSSPSTFGRTVRARDREAGSNPLAHPVLFEKIL
jgi:hypothetical protein